LFAVEASIVTSRGISKINKRRNLGMAQRAGGKMLQLLDDRKGTARQNVIQKMR